MFKKSLLILSVLTLSISSTFACWVTEGDFKNMYFAGVNFYFENSHTGALKEYHKVSLPLTLWFKVATRDLSINSQETKFEIIQAGIYYKVLKNNLDSNATTAKWRKAGFIDLGTKPKWKIDFKAPVKLFGNATITKNLIERNEGNNFKLEKGDGIILVWWFCDNQALMNGDQIEEGKSEPNILPKINDDAKTRYDGDYYRIYTMRVIYNGKNITVGR